MARSFFRRRPRLLTARHGVWHSARQHRIGHSMLPGTQTRGMSHGPHGTVHCERDMSVVGQLTAARPRGASSVAPPAGSTLKPLRVVGVPPIA